MAEQSAEEFRKEQQDKARAQGLTAENAVPEKRRDRAVDQDKGDRRSPIVKARAEAAEDDQPMDKAAYDRADSDAQRKKAAKDERHEALKVADKVRVVDEDDPNFGRTGAVVRCVFSDEAHAMRNGQPSQRFIDPEEVEVSWVGDEAAAQNDLMKPEQLERIIGSGGLSTRERIRNT